MSFRLRYNDVLRGTLTAPEPGSCDNEAIQVIGAKKTIRKKGGDG
jgi:hypothetical protein